MLNKEQVFRARDLYINLEKLRTFVFYDNYRKPLEITLPTLGSPKIVLSEEATASMLRIEYDNIVEELTELGVNPLL